MAGARAPAPLPHYLAAVAFVLSWSLPFSNLAKRISEGPAVGDEEPSARPRTNPVPMCANHPTEPVVLASGNGRIGAF